MNNSFMNSTSLDKNNSSNVTVDQVNANLAAFIHVLTYIVVSVGLPLTLVAIYAIFSLIRKDHVAPIYVINLLISDLIQLCCVIGNLARPEDIQINVILARIYAFSMMATVSFMVCIALERYLVIAWPLWYRFRRTIRTSLMVCAVVWALPLVIVIVLHFLANFLLTRITFGIFFLLPLPLLIFFLVGTLKALSASIAVPSDEKRRILGVLVLVVIIYALMFLPVINLFLVKGAQRSKILFVSRFFLRLSPLVDLTLYIFMRRGMIDKLLTSVCCCRVDNNDTTMSSV